MAPITACKTINDDFSGNGMTMAPAIDPAYAIVITVATIIFELLFIPRGGSPESSSRMLDGMDRIPTMKPAIQSRIPLLLPCQIALGAKGTGIEEGSFSRLPIHNHQDREWKPRKNRGEHDLPPSRVATEKEKESNDYTQQQQFASLVIGSFSGGDQFNGVFHRWKQASCLKTVQVVIRMLMILGHVAPPLPSRLSEFENYSTRD